MIAVGVEVAVMAAQMKTGAAEAAGEVGVEAEAEVEAEVAAKVAAEAAVTVNPKIGGKTVKITKNKTEIIKTKTVLKLHRVHQTHIKTKSAIPAVL